MIENFPSEEENQRILQLLQQQQVQAIKPHQKLPLRNKSVDQTTEYAKPGQRIGMKRSGGTDGEIIQVQGGHIIRATGRKDRHSKVYTAKGPRDRRVRLSAHTAIQFYDVQDRLGYDRPSKAVEWLIQKAKNAIDKITESPLPNETTTDPSTDSNPGSSSQALEQHSESSPRFALQQQQQQQQQQPQLSANLFPSTTVMQLPAEPQSIADSMKSFFPTNSGDSLMNMQSFPHERMPRAPVQTEDLGLSLHSTLQGQNLSHRSYTDEVFLSEGSNPLTFESNYQKTEAWNGAAEGENRIGFIYSSHSIPQQLLYSQSSALSQREPLQSNYAHLLHSWNERQLPSVDHHNTQAVQQSSVYHIPFGSNFQVPAQIHGEEEPGVVSIQTSDPQFLQIHNSK